MNSLTYKEAYDKIIEAYFKDKILPYKMDFCFCGTLTDGLWQCQQEYSFSELKKMECALLKTIRDETVGRDECNIYGEPTARNIYTDEMRIIIKMHPNYETALFNGMCAALAVLKEIHRSIGEDVDEEVKPFTKRQLENTHI